MSDPKVYCKAAACVIGQDALQRFRAEMGAKYRDPYSVIVKQSKLPLSLLEEPKSAAGRAAAAAAGAGGGAGGDNNGGGSVRQEMQARW